MGTYRKPRTVSPVAGHVRSAWRRALVLAAANCAWLAPAARAEPYWIAYEGDAFPEDEGWARYASDPPAERWLQDGSLFIDSRANGLMTEVYANYPAYDLAPGETFLMRWRLRIHDSPSQSVGVNFTSKDFHGVAFVFDDHRLWYSYHDFVQFEPGVFHEFEFRSGDLLDYELYIDGVPSVQGQFHEGSFPPEVGFGDVTTEGSMTEWDYLRFGVIPEPPTWLGALGVLTLLRTARGVR
jgi:hypothetical protein